MTAFLIVGGILAAIAIVVAILRFVTWSFVTVVVTGVILLAFMSYHGMPWWAFAIGLVIIAAGLIGTFFSIKWHWLFAAGVAFITIVTILVVSIALSLPKTTSSKTPEASATSSTTATPSTAAACDPKYVQKPANNNGEKVDADFEAKYAAATSGAANLSDAQKQLLLAESANNAQRLAIWSSAFGLYANPNNWQPLVEGNCLSSAGRDLYNQFAGALNAKGTTFAEGDAPANGYNTQVSGGIFQVFSAPGVTGNRKAIKVTMSNGTVVWIMVRCANVVYSSPPPGVPTTPSKPPTTPPTSGCTPPQVENVNHVCVTPKSSNPKDYRQPGDSGKGQDVGTGTKPRVVAAPVAEATPPPVSTSVTGGNGTVDTPTSTIGSQTGVTAPGATPAPTTSTTPPPNQGGGGTGVVPGF